ncbi:hypothetical protein GCM10023115_41010 [Pontixanthobacter gangjinensis]
MANSLVAFQNLFSKLFLAFLENDFIVGQYEADIFEVPFKGLLREGIQMNEKNLTL